APSVMDYTFPSGDLTLSGHLSEPTEGPHSAPGLLLCHGFPVRGRESPQSGVSFPELADRIALELGWVVLAMNFRGCGTAEGNYSMQGWLDDVAAGVAELNRLGVTGVWIAGFGTGGSLAVCEGARNPSVSGVAALATPTDFEDWARNPRRLLLHAREVQVIKDPDFPSSFENWAAGFKSVQPVESVARLAPRPLLVVHGDSDDLTPLQDGRALAAAHGDAEFRLINGAGHELRHDPRAVAVLLGWLSRQQIAVLAQPTELELELETVNADRAAEQALEQALEQAPEQAQSSATDEWRL
ncbi:MAG: alpha/beta fold hydrolase, partial [Microthrixaceae bacterium]